MEALGDFEQLRQASQTVKRPCITADGDPTPKPSNQSLGVNAAFIERLANEHECGICFQLMHEPVQMAPCLHTTCGGCLADWF